MEAKSVETIEKLFDLKASEYWDAHYVFGKETPKRVKTLGKQSARAILINTVVPFLFTYGKARGNNDYCTRAIGLLEKLPPEKNAVLASWEALGVRHPDAFTSQALLQLTNEYCQTKRCLHCAIGNRIVRNIR
jgi:hypothetical protein